jgi:hypothetical protein
MKRNLLIVLGLLALSPSAFAQPVTEDPIEKALGAAPGPMREGATVIKWKPDFTYDTVRKGTNNLVCYDQSGWPNEQPFSVQCTSLANLDRVAQNKKFEATADAKARQAALAAAEADGTRVKPEFGSVFYTVSGQDKDRTRLHVTIAVPGATVQSLGFPDNSKQGGVWLMNAGTTTAHLMVPVR